MERNLCSQSGKSVLGQHLILHKARCSGSLAPSPLPRTSTNDLWMQNVDDLLAEVLTEFSESQEAAHPANIHLVRARDAQAELLWDIAFDEIFAVQSIATEFADHALASSILEDAEAHAASLTTLDSSAQTSPEPPNLDRSVSANVAQFTGEPSKELARRLLDEEAGDEALAMDRALLMHDLESCDNLQLELNAEPLECSICITEAPVRHALRLHPCGHGPYCMDCFQHYVDMRLNDGVTHSSLGCPAPSCGCPFSERILRALLTRQQLEKMHRRDLEAAVDAYEHIRPCPTPDCPNRVVLEDGIEARLLCPMCEKEHCLLCSASPFHVGKTCEEYLSSIREEGGMDAHDAETALRRWMAEVGAKQCPNCRNVVTKQNLAAQATQSSECHKMICRSCRVKFCFGCLAILTETFTCGCTPDDHVFLDPETGGFVRHGAGREMPVAKAAAPKHAVAKSFVPTRVAARSKYLFVVALAQSLDTMRYCNKFTHKMPFSIYRHFI